MTFFFDIGRKLQQQKQQLTLSMREFQHASGCMFACCMVIEAKRYGAENCDRIEEGPDTCNIAQTTLACDQCELLHLSGEGAFNKFSDFTQRLCHTCTHSLCDQQPSMTDQ